MSKVLMESLKMDLPALAEMLRAKGRGKDTVLAHITPKEAALLKKRGGRGSRNPDTGLLEFDDSGDVGSYFTEPSSAGTFTPSEGSQASFAAPTPDTTSYTPVTPTVSADQASANQQADFGGSVSTPTNYGYGISAAPSGYNISTGAPLTSQLGDNTQIASPLAVTQGGGLTPEQQAQYAAAGTTPTTQSWGDKALSALTSPGTLAKLGLAGGLGLLGASQARKTAAQGQAVQGQEQALAQPYQTQGQQLVAQAQAGQLSPESQAAYKAAQAQSNQRIANQGGVGVQAAANNLANVYQNLLNNQYNYGLQVMNIGDNISLGAIKTGLQLDTQLNQATTNFYSQLAQMVGGSFTTGTSTATPAGTSGAI